MLQAWEDLEATSTFLVRVDLAVQAVHSLQAGLQFRGRPARPRLAPPGGRPLGTLDDPVLLGASRVVPVHPDAQADQPQRQVGRELAPRAPGPAVVDSEAAGQPPANPGQAELCPHGLEGDLLPSPEGGKPQSTAPRRCIRRSDEVNLLLHEFLFGYIILYTSARSHGARSPGRGGSLVVVPPGPETGRLVRTNVGAFAPRGRVVPAPPEELHTDQASPPGGVLSAQAHGGLHQLGRRGLGDRGVPVIRWDAVDAVETKPLEETADGGARQAQRLGDLASPVAFLPEPEHRLTDRDGDGTWHDETSQKHFHEINHSHTVPMWQRDQT